MSFDQSLAPFGLPQAVLATGARNFHGRGIDGTGIKIAVIDTLADPNHPVLKKASNGGLKLKQKAMVRNAVIADHGTATCALVGGFGGVDVAYSGVAPGCQIINYGVFTYSAQEGGLIGDEAAIASAISDACTRERVNIINLSLGSSSQLSLLTKQISLAVSKYNVLVVAAAGNDGTDAITYPAAQPECLSVGAVAYDFENGQLQKTLFSDTNNQVDVVGVGQDVLIAKTGGGFEVGSGTSFASPIVAGYAALKLQEYQLMSNGRTLAIEQLRSAVLADAVDVSVPGRDDATGYGFVTLFDEPPKRKTIGLNS